MPIQGALFTQELFTQNKPPFRIEIEAPAELRDAVGKGRLPAAVVVRANELKPFSECAEVFKNRHKKNEGKALSEYLLRQGGRIPFIDANLTGAGRLKQSVVRVEENLAQLLSLPPGDAPGLSRFWRGILAPAIQQAVAQLFAELQKLRELSGASAFDESAAS
jgi:hypothetical protein